MALTLLTGALIAFGHRPGWVEMATLALAGLALGFDTIDYSAPGLNPGIMLFGGWFALSVIVADIAYYSSCSARAHWLSIGVKIAGS